jgi:hypothetical protein
VKYQPQPFVDR